MAHNKSLVRTQTTLRSVCAAQLWCYGSTHAQCILSCAQGVRPCRLLKQTSLYLRLWAVYFYPPSYAEGMLHDKQENQVG